MSKLTYVTGSPAFGYWVLSRNTQATKDYEAVIDNAIFPKYRAAQNIANAINDACKPRKVKA